MAADFEAPDIPKPYRVIFLGAAVDGWFKADDKERREVALPCAKEIFNEEWPHLGAKVLCTLDDDLFTVGPPATADFTWHLIYELEDLNIVPAMLYRLCVTVDGARLDRYLRIEARVGRPFFLLSRANTAGYRVLVVTVDVPVGAKRERELRNGLSVPLRLKPKNLLYAVFNPWWFMALLRHGVPRFKTLAPYSPPDMASLGGMAAFASTIMASGVTHDILQRIRDQWPGTLVLKGLLCAEDAVDACELGADGVIVSNHGGRQMDAAPASVEMLPEVVHAVGHCCTVMLDSGVRCGMDVLCALASGAVSVFSGHSFYYWVSPDISPRRTKKLMNMAQN